MTHNVAGRLKLKKSKRHCWTLVLIQNVGNHIFLTTGKAMHLFLSNEMDGYVDFRLLEPS